MEQMRKRNSEHKRESVEIFTKRSSANITPILLTTCFVCMNRFPSPLGLLSRMIDIHTIAVRICVSCQKNMSLYNGISTSSFTHITEDPKGEFDPISKAETIPTKKELAERTKDELIAFCVKWSISDWNSKMNKTELLEIIP